MKKILLATVALLTACTSKPSAEQLASLAAQGYYQHLVGGRYDEYLEGKAWSDSLPTDYRQQLVVAYKHFMAKQQQDHRGVSDVRIMGAKSDTTLHQTNVFLVLCYGDSTSETIVVPMVEQGTGRWRMK